MKFLPEWGEYVSYTDPSTGYKYICTVVSKIYHDLWCVVEFVTVPSGFNNEVKKQVVLIENLSPVA